MIKTKKIKKREKTLKTIENKFREILTPEEAKTFNYFSEIKINKYQERIDNFCKVVALHLAGKKVSIQQEKIKIFSFFEEELKIPVKYEINRLVETITSKIQCYLDFNNTGEIKEKLGYDPIFPKEIHTKTKEFLSYLQGVKKIVENDDYHYSYQHKVYNTIFHNRNHIVFNLLKKRKVEIDKATRQEFLHFEEILSYVFQLRNLINVLIEKEDKKNVRYLKTLNTKMRKLFDGFYSLFTNGVLSYE